MKVIRHPKNPCWGPGNGGEYNSDITNWEWKPAADSWDGSTAGLRFGELRCTVASLGLT